MDHSSHTSLTFDELTPALLEGAPIYDAEDHEVGTVSHLHGTGPSSGVVVDLSDRQVAVPIGEIDFMRDEKDHVHGLVKWSRTEIEALPEHRHHG